MTVVVTKLAERLLLTPEVRGSIPFNGKFCNTFCQLYWEDEK